MQHTSVATVFGDGHGAEDGDAYLRTSATDAKDGSSNNVDLLDDKSKRIIKFCGRWPRHCRKPGIMNALEAALLKAQVLRREPSGKAYENETKLSGEVSELLGGEEKEEKRPSVSRLLGTSFGSKPNWYCEGPGKLGYYNNWFVTKIDWWNANPDVARMVDAFDRSNLIFSHRSNDLIFQTAVIKLLMPLAKRKRFADFTYQHHTVSDGVVKYGGIEAGYSDTLARNHLKEYIELHIPATQQLEIDVERCSVQTLENGGFKEILYISPARSRQREDIDTTTTNSIVSRFESPFPQHPPRARVCCALF